jgi:hypothetical protein
MQVWVVQKILTPGMEDGKEADLRTRCLGVAAIVLNVSATVRKRMP